MRIAFVMAFGFVAFSHAFGQGAGKGLTFAPIQDPPGEGRALAARLANAVPTGNSEFHGTLELRQRRKILDRIPIVSRMIAGETNWQMVYETGATMGQPAERLVVIHAPAQPNSYSFTLGTNPPITLQGSAANRPLANSHFWLSDLGLEFLHWPDQRLIRRETTRSRNCDVLESRPPTTESGRPYALIRSWIDLESGGLIRAEAYGPSGAGLKEFEVDKLTKVNELWQVQRMEMQSLTDNTSSAIDFKFNEK